MCRYSSLCVTVIIFALGESIVAAPHKGKGKGSSSEGGDSGSSSSRFNDLGNRLKEQLSKAKVGSRSMLQTRWNGVKFSGGGGDDGKLKLNYDSPYLVYKFYPKGCGAPFHTFDRKDVRDVTCNGAVVNYKVSVTGDTQYSLTFASPTEAAVFASQASP